MKLKKEIKIDETNIDLETVVNNCIYSTTEKKIGKWIDGKPLYGKIINCGSSRVSESIAHNISNIKQICFLNAFMTDSSGNSYPLMWFNNFNEKNYIKVYATKTHVSKDANNGWNFTVYTFMTYTKETD